MHGRRKKDVVEPTPEELAQQTEQVKTAMGLFKKLLGHRQAKVYDAQMLDMTTKALMFHPEFPTMWGYRREILLSGTVEGELVQLLKGEMKLLEKALRKSQKVYSIWFHRKWVVEQLFQACASEEEASGILDVELELCNRLLEVDERNFHCWNHRAYVMGMMLTQQQNAASMKAQHDLIKEGNEESINPNSKEGTNTEECNAGTKKTNCEDAEGNEEGINPEKKQNSEEAELKEEGSNPAESNAETKKTNREPVDLSALDLKLSKELINRNFSNYSAWHLRALLQQPAPLGSFDNQQTEKDCRVDINEELEWVQQGIYTEPNDQSLWLYHHWLTVLGRGHERLRITHCAVLGADLFVFFSGPASVRNASASAGTPVSISIAGKEFQGDFIPTIPSESMPLRTRCLPSARRRWANVWQFKPGDSSKADMASLLEANEVGEIKLEVAVDVFGNHATGAAAYGFRALSFSGSPVRCDCAGTESGAAILSLLAPEAEPSRAALLQSELERVEELLDIEPDCKLALLSKSRLTTLCVAGNAERAKEVESACAEGYVKIAELDPLRKGFYDAAKAECLLRLRLLSWMTAGFGSRLDISSLALRHLSPTPLVSAFGVRVLDVSKNDLRQLGSLLLLASLEELDVSDNQLVGDVTEAFVLRRLRRLNLCRNKMELRGASSVALPPDLLELDMSQNSAVLALLPQADTTPTASSETATFQPPGRTSLPEQFRRSLFSGVTPEVCKEWELDLDTDATGSSGKCVCRCRRQS